MGKIPACTGKNSACAGKIPVPVWWSKHTREKFPRPREKFPRAREKIPHMRKKFPCLFGGVNTRGKNSLVHGNFSLGYLFFQKA